MSAKPFSLRVLKTFVDVWWWGQIVLGVVAAVLIVSAPFGKTQWSVTGYASGIDTSALLAEDRNGQAVAVEFDGPAKLRFVFADEAVANQLNIEQKAIALFFLGLVFAVGLFFVKQLKDIVRTIDQNDPFVAENARRMRTIGILILIFAFLKGVVQLASSGYADSMIRPTGFNLNGRLEFPVGLCLVALVVIVLSEVFRHGSRLREEQSLTI